MSTKPKNILTRLASGEVILGDGSYGITLEKRGYVTAGDWTPEAVCTHPEAIEQLGIEFGRAGADITQTFTFFATDEKLPKGCLFKCKDINNKACEIARGLSDRFGTILAGGVAQMIRPYSSKRPTKEEVQTELKKAFEPLIENDVDLVVLEFFHNINEMEWGLELARSFGKPIAATMCIGPSGDESGVSPGACAVRMAEAGADIVGVNCLFDPFICLETVRTMKDALDDRGLRPFLMAQPLGFRDPDAGEYGWCTLNEYPYALEPRQITRWEARKFAREAFDLGIRVIGGCCGFEPYHIRAMAEELVVERGGVLPEASVQHSDVDLRKQKAIAEKKGSMEYWMGMHPSTGRPMSRAFSEQEEPVVVPNSVLR